MNYIPKTDKEKAIAKWENILYGGYDRGTSNCSFCKKYYNNYCEDCPLVHCGGGSPYDNWIEACTIVYDQSPGYFEETKNKRAYNYRCKKYSMRCMTVRTQEQFDAAMAMINAIKEIEEQQ